MDNKMFCFQCEQAAHCTGCTGSAGVCGKSAETANLQDELTGALIGLARAADGSPGVNEGTWSLIIEALFTTLTNVNFDAAAIRDVTARVKAEKSRLVPDCASCMSPCGHNNDYDVSRLWTADEDIRSLKSLILFGIRGMAAYAYHAMVLGYTDGEVNRFFAKALFATMSLTLKGRGKNALLKGSYPSYNEGVIGLTGHCLSFYARTGKL